MKSRFEVGDRVKVVGFWRNPTYVGTITTVICRARSTERSRYGDCYHVDLPDERTHNGYALFLAEHLEPYYDGGEPAKWADCAWKPTEIRV